MIANIAHIIDGIDHTFGGPSRSVTDILLELGILYPDLKIELHTGNSANPVHTDFNSQNVFLSFYKQRSLGGFMKFKSKIQNAPPDLFHGHGLWQYPVHQMAKMARKQKIPYIISPHGMLHPGALLKSELKKRIAFKVYQNYDLHEAICLHATAGIEKNYMRDLGFKNPIAVIPNGINLDSFPLKSHKSSFNKRNLLFLSRLHPFKGIENLIEAWSSIPESISNNWNVQIIGNGEERYIKKLKKSIANKGLEKNVKILRPHYGVEKIRAYQQADIFVLPTMSENFGMVIAEALACGTPVITTKGAPWEDLETFNCGWWIDIGVDPLLEVLKVALTTSSETTKQMGLRGRELIENKYSVSTVAMQYQELYSWVFGKKNLPEFVYE